ncbi:chromosome associated protein G [Leptinotarsa decemlineata]|uniref:chromosome associated protein G n=1 Tax=Leptinotarsa decemlineata TaxID=7539 RepID=UPI003D307B1D
MCFSKNTIMKNGTKKDMIDLFSSSQRTAAVHHKNSILLRNLYEESNHEEFFSDMKEILTVMLTIEKGGKFIEKLIIFFGKFCFLLKPKQVKCEDETEDYVEHPLLTEIISFLLICSGSNKDIVRLRACQLINKILDNLIGVEVSQELCDNLEENLLIRLQDPKSAIRQQAVISLHRIQDPSNPDDQIITQFTHLMNSDIFAKVRLLCVEKIAIRSNVIRHIINRTRDVDPNVRLSAFKRLSELTGALKISERRIILHCGFSDQSEKVREFVTSILVKAWLQYYDNDILKFMKSMRLDTTEEDIENTTSLFECVLGIIFKDRPLKELTGMLGLDDKKLIPLDNLDWETVSYWRIYVQYLSQNEEFDVELDEAIPELIYFCNYIKRYYTNNPKEVTAYEFLEHQFILKQLFLITKTFDFAEVTNRKCLNTLVTNILENAVLMSDTIEVIVSTLECSIPNFEKRTQFVSEIISEILYPMESEKCQEAEQEKTYKISQLTVKLNLLKEDLDKAIREQKFVEAERIKNEMTQITAELTDLKNVEVAQQQRQVQKRTDLLTTIKCLDIASAMLLCPKVIHLTSSMKALKEDFIQELLMSDNDSVRVKALRCYALCCIIDKPTSRNGIHLFSTPIFAYQNGDECDTQTLLVCIGAVVDLLRIYGSQLMAAPENEDLSESMQERQQAIFAGGTSLSDVLQGLVDLMDDEQYEIQEKACLGLCQLILSGRILSPSLICRLVLKWCNPATDGEANRLKQIIGCVLEKVPLMTEITEQLIEAVLMTVKSIFAAPRISPLADINVENIAKFMIALCKTSPDAVHIHSNLATSICNEIINKSRSKMNTTFSKMLLMLDLPENKITIDELLSQCDEIRDNCQERSVVNNVIKFVTKLNKMNTEICDTLDNDLEGKDSTEVMDERTMETTRRKIPDMIKEEDESN